jgi:hypothetical protein
MIATHRADPANENKIVWTAVMGYGCSWIWVVSSFLNTNWKQISVGAYGAMPEIYLFAILMFALGLTPLIIPAFRGSYFFQARTITMLTAMVLWVFTGFMISKRWIHLLVDAGLQLNANMMAIISIGMMAILGIVLWRLTRYKAFCLGICIMMAVAATIPLASISLKAAMQSHQRGIPTQTIDASRLTDQPMKKAMHANIYYLIMDGYARQDILSTDFHFDNESFLSEIEKRGFYVARRARSSYIATYLTLFSLLEMNYPVVDNSPVYLSRGDFYPAALNKGVIPKSILNLRNMNYRTVQIRTAWGGCSPLVFDTCLSDGVVAERIVTYPLTMLLFNTPLMTLIRRIPSSNGLDFSFDSAKALDYAGGKPLFSFQHYMQVHDNRFNADCTERISDGDNSDLAESERRSRYISAIKCANPIILNAIDSIVRRDPQAIIVIQADHGTGFRMNWEGRLADETSAARHERTAILNLILLPARCQGSLYPEIGTVNTMRAVLGCVNGTNPDFLEELSFLCLYENSVDFGKVVKINFDK